MAKLVDCPSFALLGQNIKQARKALGLTRKELAEMVGIDPRYLANIENVGDIPSVPILYELSRICKLSLEQYFSPNIEKTDESEQRQRINHKLMLCPDQYLPIIEGAIDGVFRTKKAGGA